MSLSSNVNLAPCIYDNYKVFEPTASHLLSYIFYRTLVIFIPVLLYHVCALQMYYKKIIVIHCYMCTLLNV